MLDGNHRDLDLTIDTAQRTTPGRPREGDAGEFEFNSLQGEISRKNTVGLAGLIGAVC